MYDVRTSQEAQASTVCYGDSFLYSPLCTVSTSALNVHSAVLFAFGFSFQLFTFRPRQSFSSSAKHFNPAAILQFVLFRGEIPCLAFSREPGRPDARAF
jgi:hypothetical protein